MRELAQTRPERDGFGFHRQNVQLLTPEPAPGTPQRVFATALGISANNQNEIANDLSRALNKPREEGFPLYGGPAIEFFGGNCTACLDEFRLALTQ